MIAKHRIKVAWTSVSVMQLVPGTLLINENSRRVVIAVRMYTKGDCKKFNLGPLPDYDFIPRKGDDDVILLRITLLYAREEGRDDHDDYLEDRLMTLNYTCDMGFNSEYVVFPDAIDEEKKARLNVNDDHVR